MIEKFFETDEDLSRTVLRLALGAVMFSHGAQKLLGWFGGHGFSATIKGFAQHNHIPAWLAVIVILVESVGAVALAAGFFTRLAAFAMAVDMIVAIWLVHLRNGFFMNWGGVKKGEGYEIHLLMIAIGLALTIGGGGRFSVDRLIARLLRKPGAQSPLPV